MVCSSPQGITCCRTRTGLFGSGVRFAPALRHDFLPQTTILYDFVFLMVAVGALGANCITSSETTRRAITGTHAAQQSEPGVQGSDLALRLPLAGRRTKYWQMRRSPRRHCSTAGWPVASEK